ncbi:MAG: Lpg1974 family pore-forming outer membrane protein [Chlamydiales bacterium]
MSFFRLDLKISIFLIINEIRGKWKLLKVAGKSYLAAFPKLCRGLLNLWMLLLALGIPFTLAAWKGKDNLAIQAEALYFSPSYDETYFVINGSGTDGMGNPTPNGKRINNPVDFDWGFRLEGIYFSCVDLRLRWTHVFAKTKKKVSDFNSPPQLWPTEIIPSQPNVSEPFIGLASSHINVMYQKGECLFDEKAWSFCCCQFSFREGIEWSYLRYHEVIEYMQASGAQQQNQFHAHTKGIGPQLGLIALCKPHDFFQWCPKPLSCKIMTTATLIAANSKSKIKTDDTLLANNKITQSSLWRLVPEWVLNFGIRYSTCRALLEAGYEFTIYISGISKLIFTDNSNPSLSFNQYSNFYVQGPFLALRFTF